MSRPIAFSFLYFGPRIDERHRPWFERAAHHGYLGVELPVNEASAEELVQLRSAAESEGLQTSAAGFCRAATNPVSPDAKVRRAAVDHLVLLAEKAAAIGAQVLAGPLHSAYGAWTEQPPTDDERARCAEVLHAAAERVAPLGVRLAIEPLNRFECYFLNTAADCDRLVRAVDHPHVIGALDTHHAHIEERNTATAIRVSAATLGHVQLSESHRGTPGSGQVPFDAVLAALDDINYRGWLVVEAFSRHSPEFGSGLRVWRDLDEGPDAVMAAGAALADLD